MELNQIYKPLWKKAMQRFLSGSFVSQKKEKKTYSSKNVWNDTKGEQMMT